MNTLTAPTSRQHEQAGKTETVEVLMRRAVAMLEANRVNVSPSKLSRLIRAHVHNCGDIHTAARRLEAYCLSYSDLTGETAVRNIMAEQR